MIQCKVETVTFDEVSQMGVILLEEINGKRVLPIWVGIFEAQAALFKIQNSFFPRPLTHDLLKDCIEQLNGHVEYVYLSKVEQNTYYAEICILRNNEKIIIDSRPSDAVALALRFEAHIYVDEKILETNGIDKEEFLKQQKEKLYRLYLESVEDEDAGKLKH